MATGHLDDTEPITFGVAGISVGHQRGRSITAAYQAPFAFTPGRLGTVTIEAAGRAFRNPTAEVNAQFAMQ